MDARAYRSSVIVLGAGAALILTVGFQQGSQRIASPGHALEVGGLAPDFTLSDYDGKAYRLSEFHGRRVLLTFFCGCSKCRSLAPEWDRLHRASHRVAVLGIAGLGPAHADEFRQATHVTFPILFDSGYAVAARYRSSECPRCWVVDERGRVAWTNRPEDSLSAITGGLRRHLLISRSQG
jgi:peroxiredoxin